MKQIQVQFEQSENCRKTNENVLLFAQVCPPRPPAMYQCTVKGYLLLKQTCRVGTGRIQKTHHSQNKGQDGQRKYVQ